ncbi:MAG: PfkB family carbohydrate kinase, partial [Pseudomonadota bacterium]
TVVVTMGKEGCMGLDNGKIARQSAFSVKAVDTNGAGSVFWGGFCFGLLNKWPFEKCLKVASIAAALSCRELGARAGIPSLAEVESRI